MSLKNDNLLMSMVTSLGVCVPSFCASVWLMETQVDFSHPALVAMGILGLAVINFGVIVMLDKYRARLGALTLPALLATVGVVLLYMMAEAINRFVADFGYQWLFPFVAGVLGLCLVAIFREQRLILKCQLGVNGIGLAVLWTLGASDRLAMPF